MKLVRCENGHYYDQDKYKTCPNCQGGSENGETVGLETGGFVPGIGGGSQPFVKREVITSQMEIPSFIRPNSESDNTVPDFSLRPTQREDDETKGFWQLDDAPFKLNPTVGWLVCINGEEKGKSFVLKSGRNFIGRNMDMDVCLKDKAVSRNRHAVVIYDPKGRKFYVQPGESKGLFYQNNQVVLSNNELSNRDILSVGNTDLMFIPFCGPEFDWTKEEA